MRFDALYAREFLFLVQNILCIIDQCVMHFCTAIILIN